MTAIRNNTSPSSSEELEKSALEIQKQLDNWIQSNKALLTVFLDAYCVVDVTNKVIEFNTAFEEICGESYRKIKKIGNFCELIQTEHCPGQCPAKQIVTSQHSLRLDEIKGASKAFPSIAMILGGIPIFSEDQKTVIGSLITIRNVSAESELQKKYDEKKKDSVTDGLTRLYNKVYTETVFSRMLKSSLREHMPLSIVMCDIDHFKQVNDKFGHQAGDYVLSLVAQMLKGESRETDVIGRFGGEEFMAVLYNTDQAGAKIFCERFRKRVETTQVMFESKPIPVTISMGTATSKEPWTPVINLEKYSKEMVTNADTALYLAKANGRNRTWQFEDIPKKKPS